MVLWVALAALLALTTWVLVRPLVLGPASASDGDDREVYAAQLEELEADRARGAIDATQADAARAEIARRLLRARGTTRADGSRRRRAVTAAVLVGIFVPAFSVGAYLIAGSPTYGDQPLAARLAPVDDTEIAELLTEAEARLAQNPDDARGWLAVAPVYQRLRRFAEAAAAYERANALLGENPQWLALQGENLAFAAEGNVTPEAKALFERALAMEPLSVRPAIFLAIADRQAGDNMAAAERWRQLISRSDGTEPWLQIANAEFMRMGEMPAASATVPVPPTSQPGSSDPQAPPIPAIGALPPARAAGPAGEAPAPPMVEAMVAQLQARLDSQGGSVEEWVRLVRSYNVLGRSDQARAAAEAGLGALSGDARSAFSADADVQEALK